MLLVDETLDAILQFAQRNLDKTELPKELSDNVSKAQQVCMALTLHSRAISLWPERFCYATVFLLNEPKGFCSCASLHSATGVRAAAACSTPTQCANELLRHLVGTAYMLC